MPVPAPMSASSTLPLHRIRFYDQTPSPITCLAFPPLPLPPARDPSTHKGKNKERDSTNTSGVQGQDRRGPDELGILLVARENGDIEIHQWGRENESSFGNWTCVKILPPTLTHPSVSLMTLVIRDPENFHSKPYSVPKLEDLRLFTAGSDSTDLAERCLSTGRILSTYPIPSPPLWSISVSPTHQLLCLATSSPSLHFLSIPSYDAPLEPPPSHLLRSDTLPSRTRTVSLAWGIPKLVKSEEDGWVWRDTYLVTGNSDSSFRKWDVPQESNNGGGRAAEGRVVIRSRAVVEKIGKVKGKKTNKGTIVWGIAVLPDHTIVTSDSLGSVTFWDGASMAQKQTFSAHKADGMCLTVGPSGSTVFSSGPDQRVCQFTYIPSSSSWAQTSTKRLHSHDVRSLAIFPPYAPAPSSLQSPFQPDLAPVLASGGWDMSLTLTPAAPPSLLSEQLQNPLGKVGISRCVFEEAFTRKLGYLGNNRISVSKGARLVVGRKERSVGIWKVFEDEEGWEKVLEMDFRLRTNLISSAVSQDGRYLAVSDLYETKLFKLVPTPHETAIKPLRVKSFLSVLASSSLTSHLDIPAKGLGSSTILFTPDSRRLVLGHVQSGNLIVVQLPSHDEDRDRDRVEMGVVKCFKPAGNLVGGRVIAGQPVHKTKRQLKKMAQMEAIAIAAAKLNEEEEDVEMNGQGDDEKHENENENENEDEDDEDEGVERDNKDKAWISCLAASDDGQWLVSSDSNARVTIYNLDTLQVHATLPTLPLPPTELLFPSKSPSTLLILSPNALTVYNLDKRRLIPPTPGSQLMEINNGLRDRYLPALGGGMDGNKLVIWGHEFLLTARLDHGSLTNNVQVGGGGGARKDRRKRAREAREALERSTSLSLSTPLDSPAPSTPISLASSVGVEDYSVKIHGTESFRGIIGVGWMSPRPHGGMGMGIGMDGLGMISAGRGGKDGDGEMVVVERPVGDFLSDLPPVFAVASFGRS